MGKVKDEQMFTLLRNFLLIYLPNQRQASANTVKAYRTAWNQLLKYISGQKKIPMMSVTFGMINYESVNSYLDWLTNEKRQTPPPGTTVWLLSGRSFPMRQHAGRNTSAWQANYPRSRFRRKNASQRLTI